MIRGARSLAPVPVLVSYAGLCRRPRPRPRLRLRPRTRMRTRVRARARSSLRTRTRVRPRARFGVSRRIERVSRQEDRVRRSCRRQSCHRDRAYQYRHPGWEDLYQVRAVDRGVARARPERGQDAEAGPGSSNFLPHVLAGIFIPAAGTVARYRFP